MRRRHASEENSGFFTIHVQIHPSQHTFHCHTTSILRWQLHGFLLFIVKWSFPVIRSSARHLLDYDMITRGSKRYDQDHKVESSWCLSSTIDKYWTLEYQLLSNIFHACWSILFEQSCQISNESHHCLNSIREEMVPSRTRVALYS